MSTKSTTPATLLPRLRGSCTPWGPRAQRLQLSSGPKPGEYREPHADGTSVVRVAPPCAGHPGKCSSTSRQKWARVGGGSKSSSGVPAGADALPYHAPRSTDRVQPNKPHGSVALAQTLAFASEHATSIRRP